MGAPGFTGTMRHPVARLGSVPAVVISGNAFSELFSSPDRGSKAVKATFDNFSWSKTALISEKQQLTWQRSFASHFFFLTKNERKN